VFSQRAGHLQQGHCKRPWLLSQSLLFRGWGHANGPSGLPYYLRTEQKCLFPESEGSDTFGAVCLHRYRYLTFSLTFLFFWQWLRNPGPQHEKRTLFGDMVCFLFITPLATISGWLCLRGAVDHLHFSSRLEAVGLIALTVALFTIYLFWTLVSMAVAGGSSQLELVASQMAQAFPPICRTSHLPSRK
jgi:hypothetical protein